MYWDRYRTEPWYRDDRENTSGGTPNITICPDCKTVLETIDNIESLPVQILEQECPSCDYVVRVSILNYPKGVYEGLAPALDDDTCTRRDGWGVCDRRAVLRFQRVGHGVEARCPEHVEGHRTIAIGKRDEL